MSEVYELTREECMELLEGGVVARVAVATPVGPRIVPLNYAMHDGAVVFRTSPYSELGTYGSNTDLALEIDNLDYDRHQGWSVVVLGRGHVIDDPDEVRAIRASWDPTPWAGGQRRLYLRLPIRQITGRRLGRDWTRAAMSPVHRVV